MAPLQTCEMLAEGFRFPIIPDVFLTALKYVSNVPKAPLEMQRFLIFSVCLTICEVLESMALAAILVTYLFMDGAHVAAL